MAPPVVHQGLWARHRLWSPGLRHPFHLGAGLFALGRGSPVRLPIIPLCARGAMGALQSIPFVHVGRAAGTRAQDVRGLKLRTGTLGRMSDTLPKGASFGLSRVQKVLEKQGSKCFAKSQVSSGAT